MFCFQSALYAIKKFSYYNFSLKHQLNIFAFSLHSGEFDRLVNEGTEADHIVDAILTHRGYKADTYHNDIALIKLTTPIKYSRFIVPACIPEQEFAEKVNF